MRMMVSHPMLADHGRIAVPYTCAAIAGVWAERSGVIQIGLEGILLAGAFSSVAVAHATGSASLGLVAAIAAGIAVSLGHGLLTEKARIHAVISGIAINLLALASTRMGLRALYDSSSNSPSIDGFRLGPTGATGLSMLLRVLVDPVFVCAVIAVVATPFVMQNTRFGLRVRAAGENPVAASSVGIGITQIRLAALSVSGAICALGGAHLAYDQHRFESGMSAGRGFIALAAVVVGGWRASFAAAACLVFGALEALQIALQDQARRSMVGDLIQALPYVATLFVLAFSKRRSGAPEGLGKHATE